VSNAAYLGYLFIIPFICQNELDPHFQIAGYALLFVLRKSERGYRVVGEAYLYPLEWCDVNLMDDGELANIFIE